MPQSPNASFIPRKSNTTRPTRSRSQVISLYGYIAYIIFFGAVFITIGITLFSMQISRAVADSQQELNNIRSEFNQSQLLRVQEYERFLDAIDQTFSDSFSTAPLFTAFEESVVETVFIREFTLEQVDNELIVSIDFIAPSFESAIFQRNLYEAYPLLTDFYIDTVDYSRDTEALNSYSIGTVQLVPVVSLDELEAIAVNLEFVIPRNQLEFDPNVVPSSSDGQLPTSASFDQISEDAAGDNEDGNTEEGEETNE